MTEKEVDKLHGMARELARHDGWGYFNRLEAGKYAQRGQAATYEISHWTDLETRYLNLHDIVDFARRKDIPLEVEVCNGGVLFAKIKEHTSWGHTHCNYHSMVWPVLKVLLAHLDKKPAPGQTFWSREMITGELRRAHECAQIAGRQERGAVLHEKIKTAQTVLADLQQELKENGNG